MKIEKNDNGGYDVLVGGEKIGSVRKERSTGEWFARLETKQGARFSDEFRTRKQAIEWLVEFAPDRPVKKTGRVANQIKVSDLVPGDVVLRPFDVRGDWQEITVVWVGTSPCHFTGRERWSITYANPAGVRTNVATRPEFPAGLALDRQRVRRMTTIHRDGQVRIVDPTTAPYSIRF
jgi:hypothetical protein